MDPVNSPSTEWVRLAVSQTLHFPRIERGSLLCKANNTVHLTESRTASSESVHAQNGAARDSYPSIAFTAFPVLGHRISWQTKRSCRFYYMEKIVAFTILYALSLHLYTHYPLWHEHSSQFLPARCQLGIVSYFLYIYTQLRLSLNSIHDPKNVWAESQRACCCRPVAAGKGKKLQSNGIYDRIPHVRLCTLRAVRWMIVISV